MLLLKVIVAFLLIQQCYSYCEKPDKPDGGCVYARRHDAKTDGVCQPVNYGREGTVAWFVDASGNLDVRFALPDGNCENITCYVLELFVDESVSEEDCTSNQQFRGRTENHYRHSTRLYATSDTCLVGGSPCQCERTAPVSFSFVFTGCYQLVFNPKVNLSSKMKIFSHRKYLRTNYSKRIIAGQSTEKESGIFVSPQYIPTTETLTITFPVDHLPRSYAMHLDTDIWALDCDNTSRECSHTVAPPNREPALCTVRDDRISCSFSAVQPGNYCLTVQITEDRCEPNTLWTTTDSVADLTCNWQHNFTAYAGSEALGKEEGSDQKSSLTYIILAAVFSVGLALTAIGLFALKYSGRFQPRTTSLAVPSSMIPLEPCRIFLLYARDCQPFMELMATLREVLEDATKCEVVDCWDPTRWNDIGRSPVEWVRGHIEHPTTKVVLAATQLAYLRQQAHLNQTITYYKEPGTYDSLFTYALKTLSDNLSHDIYRKICVIRFEGFSDDGNLFNHLTPYTRFVLPLHLPKLILSLQPSISADQDIQLDESKEVQKLSQDLTNLINYKNTNINYIQDLLVVQRKKVNLNEK